MMVLLASGLLAACTTKVEPPARNITPTAAPSFTLPDLAGNPVSSDSFKGKILVIHFCASWSPSSAREIRQLCAIQEAYREKNVQVIGLALEEAGGADMKAFASQTPFNYPVLVAPSNFHREFGGIEAIPSTFLINPSGMIMNKHTGMIAQEYLEAELDLMIREAKEAAKGAATR
ncbi:MAG: TlpA disulfide reductase family protein [Candidatus Methylacidiphilales bacterium]|nr:TlpA disulfide reductase family protein [Candidatus Methylacidiphilales bacterium]